MRAADEKINQTIAIDKEKLLSRDLLTPSLCYDLLMALPERLRLGAWRAELLGDLEGDVLELGPGFLAETLRGVGRKG